MASGPMPKETLELLMSLPGAHFVLGNADRELTKTIEKVRSGESGDSQDIWEQRAIWAAEQLDTVHEEFLRGFQKTVALDIVGLGPTLFCHGTHRSEDEIVTSKTPDLRLLEILADVRESTVVGGHTHVQFDRRVGSFRIVNAGSVGMPYQGRPGAYWALLGSDVELRVTTYNVDDAIRAIKASGMPGAEEFIEMVFLNPVSAENATEHFEKMAEQSYSG